MIPTLNITEASGISLNAIPYIDILCRRHAEDTDYARVLTLVLKPVNLVAKIDITKDFKVKIHVTSMDINIMNVINSEVGNVNTFLIKALGAALNPLIKGLVNLVFSNGIKIEWILKKLHIDWIGLEESFLAPKDGYFIFFITPHFHLDQF